MNWLIIMVWMMDAAVVIPFRDRGIDPLRSANLKRVFEHWCGYRYPVILTSDGRDGDAQFNRSLAYNNGIRDACHADVFILAESDLLIDYAQIDEAVELAFRSTGLVIPFTWFRAIEPEDSQLVRDHELHPDDARSQSVKGHKGSIGAINIVSRETYDLVGKFDDNFEGAWYDDDAMKIAFEVCAGSTRWVVGDAYHLHHLSGGAGKHLTVSDREATAANRQRLSQYRRARTPEQIRALTCYNRTTPDVQGTLGPAKGTRLPEHRVST